MSENDTVGSDRAVLTEAEASKAPRKSPARATPKWGAEARDRLRAGLRRFSKPLMGEVVSKGTDPRDQGFAGLGP